MQELADALGIALVAFVFYKAFLKFGVWCEKRAERVAHETKKSIELEEGKKNGQR